VTDLENKKTFIIIINSCRIQLNNIFYACSRTRAHCVCMHVCLCCVQMCTLVRNFTAVLVRMVSSDCLQLLIYYFDDNNLIISKFLLNR